jgi:tetracycline 7-halogenase / FADH2 O2-dependent halogenase
VVKGSNEPYDVTILGTGIAGTVLATILARQGLKILMIDSGSHPRFAVGEATTPQMTSLLKFLAARFSVPELNNIAKPKLLNRYVSRSCGTKENFGYLYHRDGQKQSSDEALMFGAASYLRHNDLHYFRQDIDAYLLNIAVRYGAEVRQNLKVTDVSFDSDEVSLTSSTGEQFQSQYVVDATGFRSLLADKFGLRDTPCRLRLQSRSLFTHMVNVRPYEDCVEPRGAHGMSSPWSRGTLHHMFDGGWLWVIPFDNHPASTNPLCSVGLSYDLRRYPKTDAKPEQEFANLLVRFPEINRQFESARPVREWVSTGRLQYSSKTTVGDRYCLMPHAAGFVDAYFSRGLVNTMEVTSLLAVRLLAAAKDRDYSAESFRHIDHQQQAMLEFNDRLVNGVYICLSDFGLWNAFVRVWALGTIASIAKLTEVTAVCRFGRDLSSLSEFDRPLHPGLQFPYQAWYNDLFERAIAEVEAFGRQELAAEEAANRIFRLLRETDYCQSIFGHPLLRPLLWGYCDPQTRNLFSGLNLYARPRTFALAQEWRKRKRAHWEGQGGDRGLVGGGLKVSSKH